MTNTEQSQWEEARSTVYGFFSAAFLKGPDQRFLETVISEEGADNLGGIFPDAAYRQELAQVRLEAQEGRLTLEGAILDFEALFRVPGPHYLSPYESVYRSQVAGGRGCLCGPETAAVEQFYLQEGLFPRDGFTELPDHVGVELECMAILCRKAVEAMKAGDPAAEEYRHQQNRFFTEHVGAWARLLAQRLAAQAQTSLYRFLGNFLNLFLGLEENLHFQREGGRIAVRTAEASREPGVRL
ncbi:MAG: molecular chaperone TorD family protein [Syntrophales bacterium]|nr:molecular chaperone TorD family protein [Syntrophales bacterium]MDD5641214.1 molecular chaperone TorD family protein [Syntrophales bacterium]